MIGKSLSLCIMDILAGKVAFMSVDRIIASTCIKTDADLDNVIESYRKTYWRDNPDEGERIARMLFAEGRIDQPRIRGEGAHNIARAHWETGGQEDRMSDESFYVEGNRGALVQVQFETRQDGTLVVTASRERLSPKAFNRALKENWPGVEFSRHDDKYIFKAFTR